MTTFYRLLKDTDKATALREAVTATRAGAPDEDRTFTVDPAAFSKVPNTPFAYWVDDEIRDLFVKLPPFESEGRTVRVGLQTSDDFRFVRAWWEVDPARRLDPGLAGAPDWREDLEGFQAWCRRRTHQGKGWAPFAKGGEYSPYYSDIHLVVNWDREGEEMKAWADPLYGNSGWSRIIKSTDYYFRPGVTWSYRSHRLCGQPLHAGVVISVRGSGMYCEENYLYVLLGLTNSELTDQLVKLGMGREGHPQFDQGDLKLLPVPVLSESEERSIREQSAIGSAMSRHLGLSEPSTLLFSFESVSESSRSKIHVASEKVNRIVESVYNINKSIGDSADFVLPDVPRPVPIKVDTLVACSFAAFDIRFARNPELVPALPDPFDPLPVVPPATLVGPNGLPATSGSIVSEEWLRARPDAITLPPTDSVATATITDAEYPIPIPWDGILVDDPDHDADIVGRIRQVLTVLHGETAQETEAELCRELGVDTLREYIANPKGFFADHLSRYSKSRRKAPIYWPLSTPSGGWTAWIYYPRLTDSTIYTLIDRYLHPRLEVVRQLYEAVAAIPAAQRSPGQQRQFDLSSRDKDELAQMEADLKQIVAMPYRVNHDDGVPILAAPFAAMFRHREWSKYLTGIWEKLEAGEYDWAHLAYAVWPERVREKARDDRSIAIAHGIET
ncbi:MAG: hypothetical protein WD492_03320 [Alkalispirochaeta sp.]